MNRRTESKKEDCTVDPGEVRIDVVAFCSAFTIGYVRFNL